MKVSLFNKFGTALVVLCVAMAASSAWAEGSRYQIVKSDNGTLWRLNTETGEIAMCKAEGARMVCASSGGAIEKSTLSASDLEAAQEKRRARKRKETAQTLDKLVDVFERLLDITEKHQKPMTGGTPAPAAEPVKP